jgi:NADPH-dependent ferric siderophore reductase
VAETYTVTVLAVSDLSGRMRRITVGGRALTGFSPWPGQDVVLHLRDDGGSGIRRRYTVRHFDPRGLRFDLDFVRHGHGPGAAWAERAEPGDELEIFGPRGKVALSGAEWQLFAGDESALPAIVEMIEALPATTTATALIEITDADDEQAIMTAAALDLGWLHRGECEPGTSQALDRAIEEAAVPAEGRHVYLFGESRCVRRLRDIVLRRGLRLDEISAKGYWNAGRAAQS